ncbi:MAG: hypothetical protein ISS48_01805 [Candidatus Aenigmarchaeota archaeon]|nr:hypothetical protein [Candidatus Aenigmarchaeota archaeon]
MIKKTTVVVLLVAIVLISGCSNIPRPVTMDKIQFKEMIKKSKDFKTIIQEYDQVTKNIPGKGGEIRASGKVWIRRNENGIPDYRQQYKVEDSPIELDIIITDNNAYLKMDDNYYKADLSQFDITSSDEYVDMFLENIDEVEIKGEETIDDKKCTNVVYKNYYIDEYGVSIVETCFWNEHGVPLRVIIKGPGPEPGLVSTNLFKNYVFDETIPDSMFEVPVDKIVELPPEYFQD